MIKNIKRSKINEICKKRFLGLIVALVLCISAVSSNIVAEENGTENVVDTNEATGENKNTDNITRLVVKKIGKTNWGNNVCTELWFNIELNGETYTAYDSIRSANVYDSINP